MPIAIEPPQEDRTNFEFDADGFLTDRRCTLELNIGRAHGRFFTRARQINRDCHELLFAAPIHNRDLQEILSATLFTRALEHYQATLILLSTGLVAPAKVTLRALLECVLTTRAVAADPDALRAFINDDLLQRRKLIRRAQQHDHPNLQELRQALSSDVIEGLEQQIEDLGAKSLKTEELSKLADMHDWYTTNYALLSKATHSNVRQLEAYLSLDELARDSRLHVRPFDRRNSSARSHGSPLYSAGGRSARWNVRNRFRGQDQRTPKVCRGWVRISQRQ